MIVVTAPTVEPVSLPQAKFHLKMIQDPADETAHPQDAEVRAMISAAREYAEQFCQRAFAAATYEARGAGFDVPLLAPVTSIVSVKYLDPEGAEQTLADTVYEIASNPDAPALRLRIAQVWPAIYNREDAVRVQFKAGPAPEAVSFLVKAAMLLIVGSLDQNRQEVGDKQTFTLPLSVQNLLMPYRVGLGV